MNSGSTIKLKTIINAALAIAMVALATMAIKIPTIGGYVNFGDIMIFITAVFLGRGAGFAAGGIGSAMADIISGYTIYAPATFIIKGLEGLICAVLLGKNRKEAKAFRLIAAMVISAAWMVFGYFMYEYKIGALLFANTEFGTVTAIKNIPGNIVQGLVSAAAALPFIFALRKTGISFDK